MVSVNLSASQLRDAGMVSDLKRIMAITSAIENALRHYRTHELDAYVH